MGKKVKADDKKSKKYALIDNNYLAVDTKTEKTIIMCGLATGISCMAFSVLPIGILMYIISILERTKTYIAQSTFILIVCGIAVIVTAAFMRKYTKPIDYRSARGEGAGKDGKERGNDR